MSWYIWLNSNYNTDNYYYNSAASYIQKNDNKIMYNGAVVELNDFITPQGAYTLEALEDNAPV